MNKKQLIISISLKIAAVIIILVGVFLNIFSKSDFMAGSKSLFYFTIQSNILAAIVSVLSIFFDIRKYKSNKEPQLLFKYLKFIATTAVAVTLIVFWILLMPTISIEYAYSVSNLSLHTFGPLLVIVEYILFTYNFKLSKINIMTVWIFPLLYLIFALVLSHFNVDFGEGRTVPYYFLNYKEFGWFKIGDGNIGVFYWILIMLAIIYSIGFVINKLEKNKLNRKPQ